MGYIDIENKANSIREKFWGKTYPVDPIVIANKNNISVLYMELENDISGAIFKRKTDKSFTIVINDKDSKDRVRFTVAHELGHYFANVRESELEILDYRKNLKTKVYDRNEWLANEFAGILLMPEKEIKKIYLLNKDVYEVADYFGVSVSAVKTRIDRIGWNV